MSFAGEPLLMPVADLEDVWRWGYEMFGHNAVQTDGVLITAEHIALFRKYRVHVGISIDGPRELNDVRWNRSLDKAGDSDARVEANIERLVGDGSPPDLITTLHTGNARAECLPLMGAWFRRLYRLGIRMVRLHPLEADNPLVRRYALSDRESIEAVLYFGKLQAELVHLHFDVVDELQKAVRGEEGAVACVGRACDPYAMHGGHGAGTPAWKDACGSRDSQDLRHAGSLPNFVQPK
jgi:uncharacterized protein